MEIRSNITFIRNLLVVCFKINFENYRLRNQSNIDYKDGNFKATLKNVGYLHFVNLYLR